jgi:DNA-binding transcriptional MocR family regulator
MATEDRLLYSALHGTAMRYAAERRNLDDSIAELRKIAGGRDDILAEAAGITAGSWYAWPSTHAGMSWWLLEC